MFNTHRNNAYTRDAFERIAKNWINVQPWIPIKKNWEFIDIAGPGEAIYWVCATIRQFDLDNETKKQEKILYYPVNEDDTYKVSINSWVTDNSMICQYADIDANFDLDIATLWSWTQLEVISILGPKVLEVSIVKLDVDFPPVPTIIEPVTLDSTNVSTYIVNDPTQENFYINADTSGGNIIITSTWFWTPIWSLITIRKISIDSNVIEYNDWFYNYQFIQNPGELITLERNGSTFLVR